MNGDDDDNGGLWAEGTTDASGNAPRPIPPDTGEEQPVKVCPKCSVQTATTGLYCPQCGAAYAKRGISKRTKITAGVLVGVVILAGAGVAVALKVQHDNDAKAKQAAAQRVALAQAAKRKAEAAVEQAKEDEAARVATAKHDLAVEIKREIVHSMEKSVTKDAKKDVADGLLDGPILGTQCDEAAGGGSKSAAPYTCLAYTKKNDDGTLSGYSFSAVANLKTGSYSWHLGRD